MRACLRVCAVLLCVLLLVVSLPIGARAEAATLPSTANADAVSLWHIESGRSVGGQNAAVRRPAGASVKLLSGLVACERLGLMLEERVEIRAEMIAGSGGRTFKLQAGDTYTWRDLLILALCGSYNDAYDVIAYRIGNGETVGAASFVELLNARARELGATSTVVGDASGLADNSYTTAEDLTLIARAAAENALYSYFVGLTGETLSTGEEVWNRNTLVRSASLGGATCGGMCVGETASAGVTLIVLAKKEHDSYLLVLMGVTDQAGNASESAANSLASTLIRWGYTNYKNTEILSPSVTVCDLPVTVSDMTDEVAVRPCESLWAYLPTGATLGEDVRISLRLNCEELEAPVTEGTPVGYAAVIYDGQVIGTVALETAGSAERSGFMSSLLSIKRLTKSRRAKAGLIFFLVCMTVWIGGETYLKYRTKAKWRQYYSSRSKWR